MNTKSAPAVQAQTQDVVRAWHDMTSAPVGDASACIDIWSGDDDCRRTDCFWCAETARWVYEDFDGGDYRTRGVRAPVAWMPAPAEPEVA